ncbi:PP2C family protein-serine/threonine phosphatase [Nocardiopsis ansamitocini]|uniref:PPM-type phosphatase domain-containing protein n=1 Tax=Nocardiopsis ansamitocini TaxID=1670832 RepID=A0A9W6UKE9_9ACTN|nr:GAF domain-containing SpoIIE family protein phosphatase [Nocardiopsis ansamitocini]GLU49518.1 hypothetical protein Nans01_38690 [Nocardiopsis ansamitocini]
MNDTLLSRTIATIDDAVMARAAAGAITVAADLDPVERLAFLAELSRNLRLVLIAEGDHHLLIGTVPDPTPRLRAALHPPADAAGEVAAAVWEAEAGLGAEATADRLVEAAAGAEGGTDPERVRDEAVQALLDGDEDAGTVVELLREERALVEWHRDEIEHTNRGVLALHAELDAASQAQRRLLEAEHAARTTAETARNRLNFLSSASVALAVSLNHEEVLRRLTQLLVPERARAARVWLLDTRQGLSRAISAEGVSEPGDEDRHPAEAAVRTRRVQHVGPRPTGIEGLEDIVVSEDEPPMLAVPLIARDTVLGVLTLTAPGDTVTPDEAVMLVELSRRAAISADNALRYERERDIAETLQRAMLTDLPARADLRLAARYLPATSGMNVGGDWYDVFLQPDDSLIGVIGDVTGHGIQAAVMMGQLRNALRAYAIEGHGPGGLLTRLHNLLRHLEPDLFASAIIARIQPGNPTVSWSSAGHLPPLLRDPDGRVHVLQPRLGAMLGLPIDQTIEDHELTLAPGSTLLLYTDGLVERRANGVDPGIDQLAEVFGRLGPVLEHDPDTAADLILEEMLRDYPGEDDVCLLLCHADGAVSGTEGTSRLSGVAGTTVVMSQTG